MDQLRTLQCELRSVRSELREERRLARTDPLTGLGNRRSFDEQLAELQTEGRVFALLAFDAANLKAANTTLGHAGADLLLRSIADVVRGGCDKAFRTGGDEFVILLPDVSSLLDAVKVRRRIEQAVGFCKIAPGVSFFLTGGEAIVRPGESMTTALNQADRKAEARKVLIKRIRGEHLTRAASIAATA